MSDIITIRDIDIITTEIKTIEMHVSKAAIYGCIEIGKRLVEAKEMVGHGGWGKYLEEKVCYSQQWATNLMNLYKEYGNAHENLFESFANSQSFGNIDVTKHILLLSVPAEERAAFAAANDAEHSTTRKLKEAIRDRDANLRAAQEQQCRAEQAEAEVEKLTAAILQQADMLDGKDTELSKLEDELIDLRRQVDDSTAKERQAVKDVEKLSAQLAKAKAAEKAAKSALEKAKENPEIPESVKEMIRQQAAEEASVKATEDLQKQLATALEQADAAGRARKEAEDKAADAQKALLLANPDAAVFKLLFTQVQDDFNRLLGALLKVRQADPALAGKLTSAVQTVLDKVGSDLHAEELRA